MHTKKRFDALAIEKRARELLGLNPNQNIKLSSESENGYLVSGDFLSEEQVKLISETIDAEFDNVTFQYNRIKK